jgi:arsenite methyltransferase
MLSNKQAATEDLIRTAVADRYSAIGSDPVAEASIPAGRSWAESLGYPPKSLDTVPVSALASFTGIGTPIFSADLSPGERVRDLGCGAGLDSILMSRMVAPQGHVYGVDLAGGMINAARAAAAEATRDNVTLTVAAAENLPLPGESVDVAVANGLFNLAPDKAAVASELRRVLRPGGRLVGAEIVITDQRPPGQLNLEGGSVELAGVAGAGVPGEDHRSGLPRPTILQRTPNLRTSTPGSQVISFRAYRR